MSKSTSTHAHGHAPNTHTQWTLYAAYCEKWFDICLYSDIFRKREAQIKQIFALYMFTEYINQMRIWWAAECNMRRKDKLGTANFSPLKTNSLFHDRRAKQICFCLMFSDQEDFIATFFSNEPTFVLIQSLSKTDENCCRDTEKK